MTERSLESYLRYHDNLDVHVSLDDLHARDDLDDADVHDDLDEVDVHDGLDVHNYTCDSGLRYLEPRCLNGCLIDCLSKQLLRWMRLSAIPQFLTSIFQKPVFSS